MTTDQAEPTTTDAGIPVSGDEHSLTIGPNGPILLQRHYLIEQMANFNRERIPERALEYWTNIDKETGERIEAAVRNGSLA